MKALALLVCLLVCIWCSEAHVYEACPSGWMTFGLSCYRYYGQTTNQITAENICRQFSGCSGGIGHLVSLNTREENTFIYNYIKSLTGTNVPPQTWLGGRRVPGSSRWLLSDGAEVGLNAYNAFQGQSLPQEQGRNCMTFSPEVPMPEWMNVNCGRNFPFMCELKANVPDPANCPPVNTPATNPQSPLHALPIRYNKVGNVEQRNTGRP